MDMKAKKTEFKPKKIRSSMSAVVVEKLDDQDKLMHSQDKLGNNLVES